MSPINTLIRDMIQVSAEYGSVPSIQCTKVSVMLQSAANIMRDLKWKEEKYEHILKQIHETEILSEYEMRQMAKAVLNDDFGKQSPVFQSC